VSIQFSATPNPNAGKFTVGRAVVDGKASRTFHNAAQAAADPVAAALFELDGVISVFMVSDFVTVTKDQEASWSELVPLVTSTLERAYS
jgi:NFU1 iron-sulfur cluster scaffold homolog, mitochondrial